MKTIDKIKEQISTGEIKFYGSDEVLDYYHSESKNINHLTCMSIENYLYEKNTRFFRFIFQVFRFPNNRRRLYGTQWIN